jgi:hypothetical protein
MRTIGMHQINPEYFDDDQSYNSVPADVLFREEPEEEEEEEDEKEPDSDEDDDGDEGYSERPPSQSGHCRADVYLAVSQTDRAR